MSHLHEGRQGNDEGDFGRYALNKEWLEISLSPVSGYTLDSGSSCVGRTQAFLCFGLWAASSPLRPLLWPRSLAGAFLALRTRAPGRGPWGASRRARWKGFPLAPQGIKQTPSPPARDYRTSRSRG